MDQLPSAHTASELTRASFVGKKLDPTLRMTKPRNVVLSQGPTSSTHYHDCMELGHCYSGAGVMIINQRVYPFHAGDTVLVWPGQLHMGWTADGNAAWKFFNFDGNALPVDATSGFTQIPDVAMVERAEFQQVFPAAQSYVGTLASAIFSELEAAQPGYAAITRNLLAAMLIWVGRQITAPATKSADPVTTHAIQRLQPAITRMATSYSEPLAVGDLAGLCCMSERTFRRAFQSAIGTSPLEYLLRLRVNTACALLTGTKLRIAEVASRVGHSSATDFSRAFRKYIGVTPKTYRQQGVHRLPLKTPGR
jgi:AraC-like DNA-binding protein/quercetin dioxygenase-like cupin family protein